MNEMELLRELAQETPLPAPGELDAARARLVAAIATDPATHATAAAQATVDQPSPSAVDQPSPSAVDQPSPSAVDQPSPSAVGQPSPSAVGQPSPSGGQPVDLLRPAAPTPVLTAVKLMYGGAASTAAVFLIAALPFIGDVHGRFFGHRVTATPLTITLAIVIFGLVPIALWLWMARAAGQGRNWARIVSTVLFVLATPGLQGEHGLLSVFVAWLTWLTGLAVVWLLWRPASRAFFKRYPVRADHAGITLGRQRYPLASRPAMFVPWADVEQIILYTGYQGGGPAPWIGIRRREGAPALPSGNEQDLFCPVPGVPAWATRRIKGVRLDRERLAAVTATVAPGISVIQASAGPGPGVAGPGRSASAPEGPD